MSKYREAMKLAKGFSQLTQLGLSLCIPLVAFVWLAGYLCDRFGAPQWIVIIAIFAGLATGFCTFMSFVKTMNRD